LHACSLLASKKGSPIYTHVFVLKSDWGGRRGSACALASGTQDVACVSADSHYASYFRSVRMVCVHTTSNIALIVRPGAIPSGPKLKK